MTLAAPGTTAKRRPGQIIVTGASRGIGAAIAVELVRRGFQVVGLSRTGVSAAGTGAACDMADEASIIRVFREIAARGPILGVVNNAGVHAASPSAALPLSELESCIRLNASGVMVACREAYPHLRKASGALIVNIGSNFDKMGVAGNVAYCASKAAVGAIARCLAVEWAKDGIGIVNVAPGLIATDLNKDFLANAKIQAWVSRQIPASRAGSATEVATLVGALYAEEVGFLTGETIYVDGGQAINH